MFDKLEEGGQQHLAEVLQLAIHELTDNFVTHANSESGFVAAQTYQHTHFPRIEFCVADMGQGIRQSFQDTKHKTDSHSVAILAATTQRISSKSDRRGIGLASTIREITQSGGDLSIISGDAMLNYTSDTPTGDLSTPVFNQSDRGTIISVYVPL